MRLKERLKNGPFLFDGAMGTCLGEAPDWKGAEAELACLEAPELVRSLHEAYLQAGADALKTNTFGLSRLYAQGQNADALLLAGLKLAREAAGEQALVFGDIGPVGPDQQPQAGEVYIRQAELFLENGADGLLVETQPTTAGLAELAAWKEEHVPECDLIVSFAVGPDGISQAGHTVRELFEAVLPLEGVDAIGLNCMSGPHHLLQVLEGLGPQSKPVLFMPNAGYPTVLGRHVVYGGQPDYYAKQAVRALRAGASLLGGCCGTTPEHIRALREAMPSELPASRETDEAQVKALPPLQDRLAEKWAAGKKVLAVEYDPPRTDAIASFMEGMGRLKEAGADLVTIADNPIGRSRADASLLACKVKRELGLEVLPHMTCRDRNLNAARALLIALSIEDVHNVLLVTGDPVPADLKEEVKSVYSFNSRRLAAYVKELEQTSLSMPFRCFGALDVNARNFDVQLQMAKEKEAAGIEGFLTQPVLSKQALENLKRARRELSGKILGGIYPVVSERNARFLANEIHGMAMDEAIIEAYAGLNRTEAEALARRLSLDFARAMADWVDGYYIMTPFSRVGLSAGILQDLRAEGLA